MMNAKLPKGEEMPTMDGLKTVWYALLPMVRMHAREIQVGLSSCKVTLRRKTYFLGSLVGA